MTSNTDPWEFNSSEQALLQLAGNESFEGYHQDRALRAEQLMAMFDIQPSDKAFEIGSGDGAVAKILSNHVRSLDCNDISHSFIEVARKNCAGIKNVRFHKITADYLAHLPANSYDFGFSLNVFIHFNPYDIFLYLKDVKRILKPGSGFYFDACTLGEQTATLFREHADMYRADPLSIRGLLNFNHPQLIAAIAGDLGLKVSDKFDFGTEGWLKCLVQK